MKNKTIEAEGGELILSNDMGDYIIIPKNKRQEVLSLIQKKDFGAIDKIALTLPVDADYAQDGTLISGDPPLMLQSQTESALEKSLRTGNSLAQTIVEKEINKNIKTKPLDNPLFVDINNLDEGTLNVSESMDKEISDEKEQIEFNKSNFIDSRNNYRKNYLDSKNTIILSDEEKELIRKENDSFRINPSTYDSFDGVECEEDHCAKFVAMDLYRSSGLRNKGVTPDEFLQKTGIGRSSWFLSDDIVKKGGEIIYDQKAGVFAPGDASKIFKVGDVLSINTQLSRTLRSGFQDEANEDGDGNTHSAYISKIDDDGTIWTNENLHSPRTSGWQGVAYSRKMVTDEGKGIKFSTGNKWNTGANYSIKKVTRPNYQSLGSNQKQSYKDFNKEVKIYPTDSKFKNEAAEKLVNYANDNIEKISDYLHTNQNETLSLMNAALGIIEQESGTGDSKKFALGRKTYENSVAIYKGLEAVFDKDLEYGKNTEESSTIARVKKDMNFNKSKQAAMKSMTGDNDLNSDESGFLMTVAILNDRYQRYKNKGIDKQEAMYRAIAAFNTPSKAGDRRPESYASNFDLDYANKALYYGTTMYNIGDGKSTYKNTFSNVASREDVIKNSSLIKSLYSK